MRFTALLRRLALCSAATALVAVTGCDGKTGVRGSVSFNGQPVEQGTITFEPVDGQGTSSGAPIANGRYEVVGVVPVEPGAKIIKIRAYRTTGKKLPKFPGSSDLVVDLVQVVPADFNDNSTLRRDLVAGQTNELNFELSAKQ